MTGYTRQSSAGIQNGLVIDATLFDNEYDQLEAAFNASTGHTHDGSSAEGAPIVVIGPSQEYVAAVGSLSPKTDDTYDLGTTLLKWKDLYVDGVAYLDTINLNGTAITSTATELNILDGVTATTAEINILDGVTATASEINVLDGITATTVELNYVDGVTSSVQTQLDAKANASVNIIAGNGLTGGGALSTDRTLNVGAGDGITVAADTVAVDTTVVRTTGTQTIAGLKTFTNNAQFDDNLKVGDIDIGEVGTDGFQLLKDATLTTQRLQCRALQSDTTGIVNHYKGTTNTYRVRADGNVLNANNSYGALSDSRLKKNVEDCGDQLEDIKSIRVIKYHTNSMEDTDPKHVGVIAQELFEVKPGLVSVEEDGFYSVKYSVFVPILLKAIQELAAKVDLLEERVSVLEGV